MKRTLLVFLFSIIFRTSRICGVYIKNEELSTKLPSQHEELPWLSFFDKKGSSVGYGNERDNSQIQQKNVDLAHSGLCAPGETGQFPYFPDCKRFINCWKGRGTIQLCAPGTLFNGETLECDFPGKVKCHNVIDEEADDWTGRLTRTEEKYSRLLHQRPESTYNLRIARKNQNEPPEAGKVPAKTHFQVDASHKIFPIRLENQFQGGDVRPTCALGATGLYPHPYDCTKFLKCWSGQTFIQNCGPGTFFNPLISACDHPRNVPCAHEGGFHPVQTAPDIQLPEESAQYEKYQDVNLSLKIPQMKSEEKAVKHDTDSRVGPSTFASDTDDTESVKDFQREKDGTERKPKVINTKNYLQNNQFKNNVKFPASNLTSPQNDVYRNIINSDIDSFGPLNVLQKQTNYPNEANSQNPTVNSFDSSLTNYPLQGPHSTSQKKNVPNADQTKNYYGYMLNEKQSHMEHPLYSRQHLLHPRHPLAPQLHFQHSQNHYNLLSGNPAWSISQPSQPQYFPYYAPNHPFFLKAQTGSPQNFPQVLFNTQLPATSPQNYSTDFSTANPCSQSKEASSKEPSAPECDPGLSFYNQNSNLGTVELQSNFGKNDINSYPTTSQFNAAFSEKQMRYQYNPQPQLYGTPYRPQSPSKSQYQLPFSREPQSIHEIDPVYLSNTHGTSHLDGTIQKHPLHHSQVTEDHLKQHESSNHGFNYPAIFTRVNNSEGTQFQLNNEKFPSDDSKKLHSSDQNLRTSPYNPQYGPYLFYHHPINPNLYTPFSSVHYPKQNAEHHIPSLPSFIYPSASNTGQTFISDPNLAVNESLGTQNELGAPANVNWKEKSPQLIPFGHGGEPNPLNHKNYASQNYNFQSNEEQSKKLDNFYPAKKNERTDEPSVYDSVKVSPKSESNSSAIAKEPQVEKISIFPPFPGSASEIQNEDIKINAKTGGKMKTDSQKNYLLKKIDVRTRAEGSERLGDAENISTTQISHKKSEEEKVNEILLGENNNKPQHIIPIVVPNQNSRLGEPDGSQKENDRKKLYLETEEEQIQKQHTEKAVKLESSGLEEKNSPKESKKPSVKVRHTPPNGQTVRLRNGASHLDGYLEMKGAKAKWGLVCDHSRQWGIAEATVACRELGFIRGAELSWQGYPIKSESEKPYVAIQGIKCKGTETSISECEITNDDKKHCDVGRDAVGLRCFDNLASHCQPGEILYSKHCYNLHEKENPDDPWIKTEDASEYCKKLGGKLVDITSQYENDFISEWLIKKHPDVTSVATGGIGISVLGRPMWLWEGTNDPMVYERWWSGWSGDQDVPKGSIDGPLCIILRKTFSCADNDDQRKIAESIQDVGTCSADYFFWDVEDCNELRTSAFICERPMDDIGCVVGNGEAYLGTANTTASGLPCLPWDHPKAVEGLARRERAQERSSRLVGHNYCRNLGNPDRHPWCFVEGKGNSEYCAIPQCWVSVSGSYARSWGKWSSCSAQDFECKTGECIKKEWVCDGQKDCSNGRDEETCRIFLQEFRANINKRLNVKENEIWPNVNENVCAKLCLENKNFKCRSFSFFLEERNCFLSEMNVGLSGRVVNAKGWVYHERSSESLKCTVENGFFECRNGKCVNISNVCDRKKNCEDGSDETNCELLGYQIRLNGSVEKHKGRIEVKILGKWGVICDDMFDMRDAEVICHELGFKLGAAEVLNHSEFPIEKPLFLVDHLNCLGNETTIRDCPFSGWGKHNCGPEEIAGVSCRVPGTECPDTQWQCKESKECIPLMYLCDKLKDCDDGTDEDKEICESPTQIRLAGGSNEMSGRLEIRHYNIWGTVCHDDFSSEAGKSVCSLLGFKGPSKVKKFAHFGPGKGPIWLDSGLCFINETNLDECSKSIAHRNNCEHDEDVSLICTHQELRQKSSAIKPIAASSQSDEYIQNTEEKLKQVLLSECSGEQQGRYHFSESFEKVVGGSKVAREALPWQASVRVRSGSGKSVHWCGAIVISPYHVLTAGHCLRDYNKAAYFIRVGDYDTKVPDPNERDFAIEKLFIHPNFSKTVNLNNDIGLIKVKGEIGLGDSVKPACLAPSLDVYRPGKNCSVSGWGSVSPSSAGYARTLRRAFVPILEPNVCRASYVYGKSMSEGMFCAGYLDGSVDSCQGDSGGPLMCLHEEKEYLFGITSWGHGCGRANKPGVYTNVAYYIEWIKQNIQASLLL